MTTIALDFDGVLHSDIQGQGSGNIILDPPVEGAFEKLHEMLSCPEITHIYIFSLRCGGQHGVDAMGDWILAHYRNCFPNNTDKELQQIFSKVSFTYVKPHVDIYIDDKAIRFNGSWSDPQFTLENLLNFRSWNR